MKASEGHSFPESSNQTNPSFFTDLSMSAWSEAADFAPFTEDSSSGGQETLNNSSRAESSTPTILLGMPAKPGTTSLPGVDTLVTGDLISGGGGGVGGGGSDVSSSVAEVTTDASGLFQGRFNHSAAATIYPAALTRLPSNDTQGNDDVIKLDHVTSTQRLPTRVWAAVQDMGIISSQDFSSVQSSTPRFDNNDNISSVHNNVTVSSFPICDNLNHSINLTDINDPIFHLYNFFVRQFDTSGYNDDGDGNAGTSSTAVLVAKTVTLALLALAGVVGNALLIWSIVRRRHLHRPPFYYLLSLSLTDLSRAAFCLPLVLMTVLQGSVWRHGTSACNLFAFANSFFVLSSNVSLLDIAADRHLSLVYPRIYKRRAGGAVNLVVVLLGWALAFLVAFPPVLGVGAYSFQEDEGQCTLRHKFFSHNNDTLGFLLVFTALILLTLYMYYRIFRVLRAHRKMKPLEHAPARSSTWNFVGPGANGQAFINWMNGFGGTNAGHLPILAHNNPHYSNNVAPRVVSLHVARNQHVIRLFFLLTIAFNAAWLPYQILSYWRVFGAGQNIRPGFVTAAAWISYGQVVVCPLVYFTSRFSTRRRPPRGDVSPDGRQHELLSESLQKMK